MVYSQQGIFKGTKSLGKIFAAGAAAVTLSIAMFASAFAAAPQLKCFQGVDDGFNGTCVLNGGVATINTFDGDEVTDNNYAGVYYEETGLNGVLISEVNAFSFEYDGTGAAGGSPRATVPIDKNGDGTTESYVSMDTLGCSNGSANEGKVDVANDPTCIVADNATGESYVNWAAFVTAHPDYRVATDAIPFVIVDQAGMFDIWNVVIGTQTDPKAKCMNNGWKTYTGKSFKNQGQCIAYVQSSANSKHHRPVVE